MESWYANCCLQLISDLHINLFLVFILYWLNLILHKTPDWVNIIRIENHEYIYFRFSFSFVKPHATRKLFCSTHGEQIILRSLDKFVSGKQILEKVSVSWFMKLLRTKTSSYLILMHSININLVNMWITWADGADAFRSWRERGVGTEKVEEQFNSFKFPKEPLLCFYFIYQYIYFKFYINM